MTAWQIILHPREAQSEIASWKETANYWRDRHAAVEKNLIAAEKDLACKANELRYVESELDWLQDGPGVKKVIGGWIVRRYPLHAQQVWDTLRGAICHGMEAE